MSGKKKCKICLNIPFDGLQIDKNCLLLKVGTAEINRVTIKAKETAMKTEKKQTVSHGKGYTEIRSTYGDDRLLVVANVMCYRGDNVAALVSEIYEQEDNCRILSLNKEELRQWVLDLGIGQYDELAEKYFDRII